MGIRLILGFSLLPLVVQANTGLTLDVDGDGDADANDGVMIQRRLTGAGTITTNISLPTGSAGSGEAGSRSNAEVVTAVDAAAAITDVDGDGDSDANDGVMIQRRLTGAGTVTTNIALPAAVGGAEQDGSRTNSEIVAVIDSVRPGVEQGIHAVVPEVHYDAASILYRKDFNDQAEGAISATGFCEYMGGFTCQLKGRGEIIAVAGDASNRQLQLVIAPGSLQKSLQTYVDLGQVSGIGPNASELYFSYRIRFTGGFDWRKGGKLPGLGGKPSPTAANPTGCTVTNPDAGFSVRSMFRAAGDAQLYLYHQDKRLNTEPVSSDDPKPCGDQEWLGYQGKTFRFQTDTTYLIEQRVVMNSAGQADGVVEVYINGIQVQGLYDKTWSQSGAYGINTLFFDIWHGGSGEDWAPLQESTVLIDDVVVSTDSLSF